MRPDPFTQSAYAAGYAAGQRELAGKRAQSRAAQPRRKDNRKTRARRAR